jgi:hypothetical protein
LAKACKEKLGYAPIPDDDFARDVQQALTHAATRLSRPHANTAEWDHFLLSSITVTEVAPRRTGIDRI